VRACVRACVRAVEMCPRCLLGRYILDTQGIVIDPTSMFDVQVGPHRSQAMATAGPQLHAASPMWDISYAGRHGLLRGHTGLHQGGTVLCRSTHRCCEPSRTERAK
jgi:hypothetical protein